MFRAISLLLMNMKHFPSFAGVFCLLLFALRHDFSILPLVGANDRPHETQLSTTESVSSTRKRSEPVPSNDHYVWMRYHNAGVWTDNKQLRTPDGASNPNRNWYTQRSQNHLSKAGDRVVFLSYDNILTPRVFEYQGSGPGYNRSVPMQADPRNQSNMTGAHAGLDGSAPVRFDPLLDSNPNIIDVLSNDENADTTASHHAELYYKAIAHARGMIRYVDKSGKNSGACTFSAPCLTIAYAYGKAEAGDTIQVNPGTYSESLNLNRAGTSSGQITVQGYSVGKSCPTTLQTDAASPVKTRTAPRVTINRASLSAQYNTLDCFKIVTTGPSITGSNTRFVNNYIDGTNMPATGQGYKGAYGSNGVTIDPGGTPGPSNVYVGYNYIQLVEQGIQVVAANSTFEGNEINGFQYHGKRYTLTSIQRTNNMVTAQFTPNADFGTQQTIYIFGVSDRSFNGFFDVSLVSGGTATWSQTGANAVPLTNTGNLAWAPGDCDYTRVWGDSNTFRRNYFHGMNWSTMCIEAAPHVDCWQSFSDGAPTYGYSRNMTMDSNTCDSFNEGFMLSNDKVAANYYGSLWTVTNNVFLHSNNWCGVFDSQGLVVNFYNNTCLGENAQLVSRDSWGSGGAHVTVVNNIFTGMSSYLPSDGSCAYTAYYCAQAGGSIAGSGRNVQYDIGYTMDSPGDINNVDPKIVSASDGHLQAGSPAIGQAINVGLTTDHDGNARPSGGIGLGNDIGAYQYLAPSPFNFLRITRVLAMIPPAPAAGN